MAFEEGQELCFYYALLPFGGEPELDGLSLARAGLEFVVPPYVLSAEAAEKIVLPKGPEPSDAAESVVSIEPENVTATAVFSDNGRIIIRIYETDGTETEAVLNMGFQVHDAQACNAVLESIESLECDGRSVRVPLRPFEVATVSLAPRQE
jgi:alpha-mannosidase